jgi:hypothetical protein
MSMIGNYLRVTPQRLDELLRAPDSIAGAVHPADREHDPGRHLDIEKSWHAIQFLLTGEPWEGKGPFQNAVMGGRALSEEDVGYGPARYLLPDEVKEVALALAGLSGEALWERFDPKAFERAEIYPQGWSDDGRDYVIGYYAELQAFFREAANAGDAMLLYLD